MFTNFPVIMIVLAMSFLSTLLKISTPLQIQTNGKNIHTKHLEYHFPSGNYGTVIPNIEKLANTIWIRLMSAVS